MPTPAYTDTVVNFDQITYNKAVPLANGTDLNTVVKAGWYNGCQLVNSPNPTDWHYIEVQTHSNSSSYCTQRATGLVLSDDVHYRNRKNSIWGPWIKLRTSTNLSDATIASIANKQNIVQKLDVTAAYEAAALPIFLRRSGGTTYQGAAFGANTLDDFSSPAKASAMASIYGLREGALRKVIDIGPQNVLNRPVDALGTNPLLSSFVCQATSVAESTKEFVGVFTLLSNRGSATSGNGVSDKVALFAGITARAGTGDVWSLNTVLTLDSDAGNPNAIGYELDINNQCRHYGDAFGPAGAVADRNLYGLLITGVGTYRSSAAIAINNVVQGAWNRGFVAVTGSISNIGSTFQDLCNGHQASIDILGAPIYGIRQSASQSKNWLNGRTIIGGDAIDPLAHLHVVASALGPNAGQRVDIFRTDCFAGPTNTFSESIRITAERFTSGDSSTSALTRLAKYGNGFLQGYIDFDNNSRITICSNGASVVAFAPDRHAIFDRPLRFADLNAFPATNSDAGAASAGVAIGGLYRTSDNTIKIRTA